ncbi:MAG: hypothetical protein FD138_266 [Planctomycetota bacterium]|nr:MAG: hypothetical protein FD138_266 [Planctomycetota bacterium]
MNTILLASWPDDRRGRGTHQVVRVGLVSLAIVSVSRDVQRSLTPISEVDLIDE